MPDHQPWLWVITGPNGAGKTTIRQQLPEAIKNLPFLNLDEYAAKVAGLENSGGALALGSITSEEKLLDCYDRGRERLQADFERLLQEPTSFSVETTFPSENRGTLGVMGNAFSKIQAAGWKIGIVALGMNTPETCNQRVADRMQKGGHDVAAADVTWKLCSERTAPLLKLADRFMVYDNSGPAPVLVARKDQKYGQVTEVTAPANTYMQQILHGVLPQRTASLEP